MARDWAGQKPDSSFPSFIHPETVMRACSVPHPERYWEADLSPPSPQLSGKIDLKIGKCNLKLLAPETNGVQSVGGAVGGRIRLGEEGMPWKDKMIRS